MKTFKEYLIEKVVSAGIIISDGRVILAGRATGLGKWDLPKGHVEDGESVLNAAIRETFEETNLKINPKKLIDLGLFKYNPHKDLHLFLLKTNNLPLVKNMKCTSTFINHEGKETLEIDKHQYLKINELNKFMHPNLSKLLKKIFGINKYL